MTILRKVLILVLVLAGANSQVAFCEISDGAHSSLPASVETCVDIERRQVNLVLENISDRTSRADMEALLGVSFITDSPNHDLIGDETVTNYKVPLASGCIFFYDEIFNKESKQPTGFFWGTNSNPNFVDEAQCWSMQDILASARKSGWHVSGSVFLTDHSVTGEKDGVSFVVRAPGGHGEGFHEDLKALDEAIYPHGCVDSFSVGIDLPHARSSYDYDAAELKFVDTFRHGK